MRVLVTGGAGFIGSHIVECLSARGDQPVVVDDLSSGCRQNIPPQVEFHCRSVMDAGVEELLAGCGAVTHAAAQTSVAGALSDPGADARTNIVGTIRTVCAAARSGTQRVIYLSSAAVYGDATALPISETHPVAPASPYGLSKWTGEQYVRLISDLLGLEWVVLRLANVYGPRQSAQGEAGVVAGWCSALKAGGPVLLHGDRNQTRDFVYAADVAEAVVSALRHPDVAGNTLNVGTGAETSLRDLLTRLEGCLARQVEVCRLPGRPGDINRSVLDTRLIHQRLGWAPRTSLDEGLARTLAWRDAHDAGTGGDIVRRSEPGLLAGYRGVRPTPDAGEVRISTGVCGPGKLP